MYKNIKLGLYYGFISKRTSSEIEEIEGLYNPVIDFENNEISLEYDSNIFTDQQVLEKICELILEKSSALYYFDKCDTKSAKEEIIINKIENEHEFLNLITDLFKINGVVKVTSDYDFKNNDNIKLDVEYNEDIVSLEKINECIKEYDELKN